MMSREAEEKEEAERREASKWNRHNHSWFIEERARAGDVEDIGDVCSDQSCFHPLTTRKTRRWSLVNSDQFSPNRVMLWLAPTVQSSFAAGPKPICAETVLVISTHSMVWTVLPVWRRLPRLLVQIVVCSAGAIIVIQPVVLGDGRWIPQRWYMKEWLPTRRYGYELRN